MLPIPRPTEKSSPRRLRPTDRDASREQAQAATRQLTDQRERAPKPVTLWRWLRSTG